jgi:hypothetical protein
MVMVMEPTSCVAGRAAPVFITVTTHTATASAAASHGSTASGDSRSSFLALLADSCYIFLILDIYLQSEH